MIGKLILRIINNRQHFSVLLMQEAFVIGEYCKVGTVFHNHESRLQTAALLDKDRKLH